MLTNISLKSSDELAKARKKLQEFFLNLPLETWPVKKSDDPYYQFKQEDWDENA